LALEINSQPVFEIRNFYTNKPLSKEIIFVNGKGLVLDSIGRFYINSLVDSNYIIFPDFNKYHIFIKKNSIKDTGVYIIYQFDKYYEIESDVWYTKRSWLGLVKEKYLVPGTIEKGNKMDVFINRNNLTLYERKKRYNYSKIDNKNNFLLLQIDQ
jgi:hypothetical protein